MQLRPTSWPAPESTVLVMRGCLHGACYFFVVPLTLCPDANNLANNLREPTQGDDFNVRHPLCRLLKMRLWAPRQAGRAISQDHRLRLPIPLREPSQLQCAPYQLQWLHPLSLAGTLIVGRCLIVGREGRGLFNMGASPPAAATPDWKGIPFAAKLIMILPWE